MEPHAGAPVFVGNVQQFQEVESSLMGQEYLAADFEYGRSHKLAIVSIATGDDKIYVLDACEDSLREHVVKVLLSATLIVHGSALPRCADQRALSAYVGDATLKNLRMFDTQLKHSRMSAQPLLISLEKLLEKHGISLPTEERSLKQKFKAMMENKLEWHEALHGRPLRNDLLRYAAMDVRYLFQLAAAQQEKTAKTKSTP